MQITLQSSCFYFQKAKHATLILTTQPDGESDRITKMKISFQPDYTALDLLKFAGKTNICFKPKTSSSSWGEYITSICNIDQNHYKKAHWIFHINENPAGMSADKYKVKNGDVIKFAFTSTEKK